MTAKSAALLSLLTAKQTPAFLRFLRGYRARTFENIEIPPSPEDALKMGFEMGYQQGYGNGLKEGVDLKLEVVDAEPV